MTEKCFFCSREFGSRKEHDDHIRGEHDPNYRKNLYVFNRANERDDEQGEVFRFTDKGIEDLYAEGKMNLVKSYFFTITWVMDSENPEKGIEKTTECSMEPEDYETMMAVIDEAMEKFGPEEFTEEPEGG